MPSYSITSTAHECLCVFEAKIKNMKIILNARGNGTVWKQKEIVKSSIMKLMFLHHQLFATAHPDPAQTKFNIGKFHFYPMDHSRLFQILVNWQSYLKEAPLDLFVYKKNRLKTLP